MTRPAPKDLYTILNLPPTTSTTTTTTTPTPLTKQHLKTAYHKALLKHHPDKTPGSDTPPNTTTTPSPPNETYTIDEITSAYKTLSDPALRAEYDRELRLDRARVAQREKNGTVFHTGLEVVDLEDLGFEDGEGEGGDYWYRGCRCGDDKGFLVTEMDLEREAEHGEVVVGCRGCSLWMKVLFAVEEEEEEEEEEDT